MATASPFANPPTQRLADFVRGIGIAVRAATLTAPTFLPGLDIRHGAIFVDEARLTYPGDMLHEAGHIAVADPAERHAPTLSPSPGEELTTIAWSNAALRHLDIDPAIAFHGAFKGGGAAIIENFTAGHYIGVPLLQAYGMSCEPHRARKKPSPFSPHAALDALTQRIVP
jgi:hypothetical protein